MSSAREFKVTISGGRRHLERTRELIHFISTQHGLNDTEADLVEMAVAEACHNALRHGGNGNQESHCDLELSVDQEAIRIVVVSKGKAFEFDSIEPFSIHQDFMVYKNGGLGIPLIKALMDEVCYERKQDKTNKLTLIKHLGSKASKRREMHR